MLCSFNLEIISLDGVQKEELSSYDVDAKTVGIAAGNVAVSDR